MALEAQRLRGAASSSTPPTAEFPSTAPVCLLHLPSVVVESLSTSSQFSLFPSPVVHFSLVFSSKIVFRKLLVSRNLEKYFCVSGKQEGEPVC